MPAEAKRGIEDVASNVGAIVMNPDCGSDGDIRASLSQRNVRIAERGVRRGTEGERGRGRELRGEMWV